MSDLDLDALERLFKDPRSVLENKELGAYKMTQPRENKRIIDCYDTERMWFALIQRLREAEANAEFFDAESKAVTKQYGEALARIAQLERVGEAANWVMDSLVMNNKSESGNWLIPKNGSGRFTASIEELRAALAAVEESVKL